MPKRVSAAVCAFFWVLCGWLNCYGQLRGSPELAQALARLPVTGAVLNTAAHPDDEQSFLLADMARGHHVRTAYLSATRGDGGQNLLGAERGEALGEGCVGRALGDDLALVGGEAVVVGAEDLLQLILCVVLHSMGRLPVGVPA